MSNLVAFLRRNAMFVTLLGVILTCFVGFGIYRLIEGNQAGAFIPDATDPVENTPNTDGVIRSFEGTYGRDATVHLSWSIDRKDTELTSLRLYHEEKPIGGDMKDLSSFSMSESLYQFPSGECTFTLKATFANGSEDTREVRVFIAQVMGITMKTENSENGILLKLNYLYDENNPVEVPRVRFMSGNSYALSLSYQKTNRTKSGSMMQAETIYLLHTDQLASGTYPITIRWIFDGANISKDFNISVEK
ncbi:MAG: hypothetical protein HFE68_00580 [Erysipelotrichaceae bacterium]|nr:hypothetical protein [Erysipelotrichaceae bacterium]